MLQPIYWIDPAQFISAIQIFFFFKNAPRHHLLQFHIHYLSFLQSTTEHLPAGNQRPATPLDRTGVAAMHVAVGRPQPTLPCPAWWLFAAERVLKQQLRAASACVNAKQGRRTSRLSRLPPTFGRTPLFSLVYLSLSRSVFSPKTVSKLGLLHLLMLSISLFSFSVSLSLSFSVSLSLYVFLTNTASSKLACFLSRKQQQAQACFSVL